ncbi:MAG: HlyD family efflux transporter periplasmic adaptor subunit [Bacteroidales bacterium]
MKKIRNLILGTLIIAGSLTSCTSTDKQADAFGNFEAIEIVVSAQGNGLLEDLKIEEGDKLSQNQKIGLIDTMSLNLQKIQIEQSIKAIYAKLPNKTDQINVLKEKLAIAKLEQKRITNLYKSDAATARQFDNVNSEVNVLKKQIVATSSTLNIQQKGLLAETSTLKAKIDLINYQISQYIITSPINGVVLTKYAYEGEVTYLGKSLFKMANIDSLICRAYISENQLNKAKIGEYAIVYIDAEETTQKIIQKKYIGRLTWVSDKAEFTPKVIQTKEQRSNLVYAIKILVPNDGSLKIGMPARVEFHK